MQAATVVINRRALRHNLQRLRELAPASKLVAVVKANAYGHGLLETARTLPDADAFGVARLEEGHWKQRSMEPMRHVRLSSQNPRLPKHPIHYSFLL